MLGSFIVYSGLVITLVGLALLVKPSARLGVPTRARAVGIIGIGFVLGGAGLMAPAFESRAPRHVSRLDEFAPAWQFHEVHTIRIAAPASRVFDAIKKVRADEIFLFRTLTWIRRGGRPMPPSVLNAATDESLIDLATRTTFIRLAEDAPRELVVGTLVLAPGGARGRLTARTFLSPLPAGFALATMNFLVTAEGPNASIVSTETRVFATDASARRRFAAYWRVIYPGSAIIRRMWLDAIARRATG